MRSLLAAAAALAVALPLLTVAAPAEAHARSAVQPSIEITTRFAVAEGDYYYDDYTKEWVIFRPAYRLSATVVCRAGARAAMRVSPVWAMTIPGVDFRCTGRKQRVTFGATGAMTDVLGWSRQRPTAKLMLGAPRRSVDSDTERIRVYTRPR